MAKRKKKKKKRRKIWSIEGDHSFPPKFFFGHANGTVGACCKDCETQHVAAEKATMAAEINRLNNEVQMSQRASALATVSLLAWKFGGATEGFKRLHQNWVEACAREQQSDDEVHLRDLKVVA